MIALVCVKRTDALYKGMRDRHYVDNKGCHGQQLHYLIMDDGVFAGIISGASAVYGTGKRDEFFELPKDRETKQIQLNQIVNNVVFRIERTRKNLATQALAQWRRRIAKDWAYLYGVPVIGFETFVVEEQRDGKTDRLGTLYKADNWMYLGETAGNTKAHHKSANSGGMSTKHTRQETVPKLLFAIKTKDFRKRILEYKSTWRGTDKTASRERDQRRKILLLNGENDD